MLREVFFIICCLYSCNCKALESGDTSQVYISGIITDSLCDISDSETIEVNFGDEIIASKIDGVNYSKAIEFDFICKLDTGTPLKLKISGSPTLDWGQGKFISTTNKNLGIKIFIGDGQQLMPNEWFNFDYPNTPSISAVLVKNNDATLEGGEFHGYALLKIEVQ